MDVEGAVSLVTGGGRGIGASIARELTSRGAGGTTIVDLDGDAAAAVAHEVGGLAVEADGTDPEAMAQAVAATERRFGPIDLLFSNVGLWLEGDVLTELSVWERVWEVNVMAHVVAIQAVLPGMLDREAGHIAITASAAGLLSSIGSATYAVTKAGAVALAEWLAIEYGSAGVGVSCLCPLAVDTAMLRDSFSERSREAATEGTQVLRPAQVARSLLDGVTSDRILILPHADARVFWERKVSDHDRWIRGMQRLRDRAYGAGEDPPIEG